MKTTSFFYAAALAMGAMLAASVALTSCSEEAIMGEQPITGEQPSSEEQTAAEQISIAVFTPPANPSDADIESWLARANAALYTAEYLTLTETYTITQGGISYAVKGEKQFYTEKKRVFSTDYFTAQGITRLHKFMFSDGFAAKKYHMRYDWDGIEGFRSNTVEREYLLLRPTTDAQRYYAYTHSGARFGAFSGYARTYTISGDTIVVTAASFADTITEKILLTTDFKYHFAKEKQHNNGGQIYDITFSYEEVDIPVRYTGDKEISFGGDNFNFDDSDYTGSYTGIVLIWNNPNIREVSNKFWIAEGKGFNSNDIILYAPDAADDAISGYMIGEERYSPDEYGYFNVIYPFVEGTEVKVLW